MSRLLSLSLLCVLAISVMGSFAARTSWDRLGPLPGAEAEHDVADGDDLDPVLPCVDLHATAEVHALPSMRWAHERRLPQGPLYSIVVRGQLLCRGPPRA